MEPQTNHLAAANGRNPSPPPRPTPPPSTEVVPRIDEHGLIHGELAGNRAAPARDWAGQQPGTEHKAVPPLSPATLGRVLAEDNSGDEANNSGDGPLAFREIEEDLVHLGIEKSLHHEHREVIRRRRYQRHVDGFNDRQLQRGLRADEETRAKKREWEVIAASQFEPASSSSSSSSDSSEA